MCYLRYRQLCRARMSCNSLWPGLLLACSVMGLLYTESRSRGGGSTGCMAFLHCSLRGCQSSRSGVWIPVEACREPCC